MFSFWKKPKTNEAVIYQHLVDMAGEGSIADDGAYFAQGQLKIIVELAESDEKVVQGAFWAEGLYFEEGITEWVAGMGSSKEQALERVAHNYFTAVLCPLLAAIHEAPAETLKISLYHREVTFRQYESDIICAGFLSERVSEQILFHLIKDELPKYLGGKRLYLIKLYAAFSVDEFICEVRINDELNAPLTALVEAYAHSWSDVGQYYTEKQCVVLFQDDEHYLPCPYSLSDVEGAVFQMIPRFIAADSEDFYEKLVQAFPEQLPVSEIYGLIPEVCFRFLFNKLTYSEQLLLIAPNEQTLIVREQMRLYGYVQKAVHRYIDEVGITQEDLNHIALFSPRYNGLAQALENGSEPEDLYMGPLGLFVGEDYCLY